MKVSGITWQEAQAKFEAAGLPASRSQVWRYLQSARLRVRNYTRRTVRLDPEGVDRVISNIIKKGTR